MDLGKSSTQPQILRIWAVNGNQWLEDRRIWHSLQYLEVTMRSSNKTFTWPCPQIPLFDGYPLPWLRRNICVTLLDTEHKNPTGVLLYAGEAYSAVVFRDYGYVTKTFPTAQLMPVLPHPGDYVMVIHPKSEIDGIIGVLDDVAAPYHALVYIMGMKFYIPKKYLYKAQPTVQYQEETM